MLPAASFWKFSRMLRSSLLLAAMVASRSGRRPKRRPVVDPVELARIRHSMVLATDEYALTPICVTGCVSPPA